MTIAPTTDHHRPNPPDNRHENNITPPAPGIDPALWTLFRRLSPRRGLRIDPDRVHDYRAAPFPAAPPAEPVPYAVYLAGRDRRYRLLCFDLDDSAGPDVVAEDLHRLTELLDDAGVRYAVAASGSTAGRHVWVHIPAGVDADRVAELARALVALLPSLDAGMLHNPATGCARPPGAPHRRGGISRFAPDFHPDPAAAVEALTVGNPPEALDRVLVLLPPAVRQSAARPVERARCRPMVDDESGTARLAGTRRALSPAVAALVHTRPSTGDYSGHLWRVLIGAALARWSRADIAELLADPAAVGLEHLRSRAHDGRRTPRSAAQSAEMLARQWARAVARAAELPGHAVPDDADQVDPRVREVTAAVAAIDAAAEASPWRWALPGGPADRDALRTACRIALAACTLTVAIDIRRWSLLTGYAASTMALAARRLCRDDLIDGPAWLAEDTPATGRLAAVWRLLPVADEVTYDQEPTGQPASKTTIEVVDKDQTQGHSPRPPPPGGAFGRPTLDHLLAAQQSHNAHDVWYPRGGLGHHTARTHEALQSGFHTIEELVRVTGYTRTTVGRHLTRLERVGLATLTTGRQRVRLGRRPLDTVARQLGTAGAGEARRVRYLTDRELHAWWQAELHWRRTPKVRKPHVPRRPQPPAQRALPVVAAAGSLSRYGRFPTRPNGRADYATAATTIRAYLGLAPHSRRAA